MGTLVSSRKVGVKDLAALDLFQGLNEKELTALVPLCRIENMEKGTVIHPEESCAEDIFFLTGKNDAIQVELPIEGFNTIVTNVISKGQLFGWSSLVARHVRTTQAHCTEDTEVIALKGSDLFNLLEKNNHMGYVVMKNFSAILCSRLTYTSVSLRYFVRQLTKSDQNWKI